MKLKIRMFGPAAEAAGTERLDLPILEPVSVRRALELLQELRPELKPLLGSVAVAVNESYVPRDATVGDGDELVLIPPVSGG